MTCPCAFEGQFEACTGPAHAPQGEHPSSPPHAVDSVSIQISCAHADAILREAELAEMPPSHELRAIRLTLEKYRRRELVDQVERVRKGAS